MRQNPPLSTQNTPNQRAQISANRCPKATKVYTNRYIPNCKPFVLNISLVYTGGGGIYTATVNVSSLRVTARYSVSRSNGTRPASVISRTRSARRIPCGVVAPASW
jgi:hypothetical protein